MDWSQCVADKTLKAGGVNITVPEDVATIQGFQCVIFSLLQFIPPVVVIAAVLMIIYSGIRMMMSPDNPKEFQAAQQTFVFAVIGLIGLGLAWVILNLISSFTGADVTQFQFSVK